AEDGAVLVFVEVKARQTDAYGGAIEAVHRRKQDKLIRLAVQYLAHHHIKNRPCRFDVVLVQSTSGGLPQIDHIQNAFDVSGDDLRW
ncbi:MAG TPA: YraN family protein, partial [Nitrospiraceae bacterium]